MTQIMPQKRSSELRPLSSEHHQALLVAFQVRSALAGHHESAGAPKDLPGLVGLARRFESSVYLAHTRAEEELLGRFLPQPDMKRLQSEHAEMIRLLEILRQGQISEARHALGAFAELLERHVRWEERELFPACEASMGAAALAAVGQELERRLVLTRNEGKQAKRG